MVIRGNTLSDAPNSDCPATRLLSDPSTVRSPNGTRRFGKIWVRSSPAACRSAMTIWSRMNWRSEPSRWKPVLTTPGCSEVSNGGRGVGAVPAATGAVAAENTVSITPWASTKCALTRMENPTRFSVTVKDCPIALGAPRGRRPLLMSAKIPEPGTGSNCQM